MDEIERLEIHALLKKYKAVKASEIIIDHTMRTGRLNKRALARSGLKAPEVEKIVAKLQKILKDYK